ncbi:unnamed protein product [Vitrella brassicaformis CCMP3155]|uniref:RRM domain-containing protein n=2 Tax=Vitrella brassicaformis TaxID=1169539 RepID=A0A0G4EF45_VITBC|nr:unnamed protein product [Vitrella brassicaformis CCMP3155]|eukprot:CEL94021.1 unnamed protein product [Vitrella brassicaformis CCMP3155]
MLDAALPSEIDYDHSLPHNSVATNGTAGFASTPGSGYKKRKMEEPPPGRLEEVRRLISPLSKDQLIDILARAASVHDDVYKEAEAIVSESPASRRLMIRNVAFSTTDESFNNLIKTYGEVDDAVLVRERDGRSKGFGFVTYKDLTSVNRILKDTVQLDGRELLIKLAADPYGSNAKTPNEGKKKLFIRNLSDKTTKDSLANAFSQFGDIEETVIVQDVHGKSKGYGFVVYSRPEDAIRAVQQPQRIVDGRMTFVSFAALGKNDRHVHGGGPGAPHFGGGSPGAPLSSGGYSPLHYYPYAQHRHTAAMQGHMAAAAMAYHRYPTHPHTMHPRATGPPGFPYQPHQPGGYGYPQYPHPHQSGGDHSPYAKAHPQPPIHHSSAYRTYGAYLAQPMPPPEHMRGRFGGLAAPQYGQTGASASPGGRGGGGTGQAGSPDTRRGGRNAPVPPPGQPTGPGSPYATQHNGTHYNGHTGAAMGVAMGGHSPGMSMMGPLQGMGYYNSSGAAANGTAGLTSHQMAGGGQMGAHHTQHGGMAAAHYGHAGQMGQQVGSMGQQGQVGQMPGPPPPYYQQQQQAAGYPR